MGAATTKVTWKKIANIAYASQFCCISTAYLTLNNTKAMAITVRQLKELKFQRCGFIQSLTTANFRFVVTSVN